MTTPRNRNKPAVHQGIRVPRIGVGIKSDTRDATLYGDEVVDLVVNGGRSAIAAQLRHLADVIAATEESPSTVKGANVVLLLRKS